MSNSFVFINIVEYKSIDIFSTCVFINIVGLAFIFYFPLTAFRGSWGSK